MILDSSVLIDIDRGNKKYCRLPDGPHSISSATFMELSVGKNLSSGASLAGVKENLEIIPVDERVAEMAGEVMADLKKRGERVEINDIYIAATGLVHDASVLTANTDHFRRVEGIEVVDWRKV